MASTGHHLWTLGLPDMAEEGDTGSNSSKKLDRNIDLLWKDFFRDPTQWWDKRSNKVDPGYPDFKHKITKKALRIDGCHNAPWVIEELKCRGLFDPRDYSLHYKNSQPSDAGTDVYAYLALLRDCCRSRNLEKGTKLHEEIVQKQLLERCADAVAIMYAKCGDPSTGKELLELHRSRNLVSWTALIAGYARQRQSQRALDCVDTMQSLGLSPDGVTYACILKACAGLKALDRGVKIHDEIVRQGLLQNDVVLGTSLVDMYAKCGDAAKAQQVLEELPIRDVVAYNAVITGYAKLGEAEQALRCFAAMRDEGLSPTAITFSGVLKSCGILGDIQHGECIHKEIIQQALLWNDVVLGSALVEMYVKCGALQKAREVLQELSRRDVVSWSSLIAGYAQKGEGNQALKCFEQMQDEGVLPDAVTYACILKACGSVGALKKGEEIDNMIAKGGLLQNNSLLGSALVDMYAKCGVLTKAQKVLEELPFPDEVCYNALIAGYVQHEQGEDAFKCFEKMRQAGFSPTAVTFSSLLKACGSMGAVDKGEKIHDEIAKQGLLANSVVLGTALVDMYAKCGSLVKAQETIDKLPIQSVVVWNALMTGYAQQPQGEQVLSCFERLQNEGLSPDAVTFSSVLNACSHLGLVDEGYMHFESMRRKFGIEPDIEHCTCMIDLFGRAGQLDKAVKWIQELPSSKNSTLWAALLSACRKWGDVNVGKWAFEQAKQIDKHDAVPYVLMADIYAAAGKQEDAQVIEALRRDMEGSKVLISEAVPLSTG
ncbi:hypothetical protein GOP47_0010976 [Adiantum capillus-veneris]|uniref:Pentatricopeptide repeat-containing protein n=1 Tax=Adiantum capillus-veneris TaxID=13818 RepID=A0A9D4UVL1_ADICA|nr:hypothetical protein GOP47_0010976 [Adiantum capillus-veneris]